MNKKYIFLKSILVLCALTTLVSCSTTTPKQEDIQSEESNDKVVDSDEMQQEENEAEIESNQEDVNEESNEEIKTDDESTLLNIFTMDPSLPKSKNWEKFSKYAAEISKIEAAKQTTSPMIGSGYDVDAYDNFEDGSYLHVSILSFKESPTTPVVLGYFDVKIEGTYSYADEKVNGNFSEPEKDEQVKEDVQEIPGDGIVPEGKIVANITIPSSLSYMNELTKIAGKEKQNADGTYTLTTELLTYSNNGYSWKENYHAQVTYKKENNNLFNNSYYDVVFYKERTNNPIYNNSVEFSLNSSDIQRLEMLLKEGKDIVLKDGTTKDFYYDVTENNGVYIAKLVINERVRNMRNSALLYPFEHVVIIDTNNITALGVYTEHCVDANNGSFKWDNVEVTYYDGKTRMAITKEISSGGGSVSVENRAINEYYGTWFTEYGGNADGLPNESMGTYILDAVVAQHR